MPKEEVYKIIREVLKATFKERELSFNFDTIDANIDLIELLEINSITLIEIIVRLENMLDIEFDDTNISPENIGTINTMVDFYYSSTNASPEE